MMNKCSCVLLSFVIFILFSTLNVAFTLAKIPTDVTSIGTVGAILDNATRAGKEARVAIEMATSDFNFQSGQHLVLRVKTSHGKPILAALEAKDLIDTYQVDAILGQQTLEEVLSIADVSGEAQIPTLSLVDSTPQWAIDRQPVLIQASPSQFAQMNAVAAILQSWGWTRLNFLYEEINSASSSIPYLVDAVREVGAEINNLVQLAPSSLSKQLQRLKGEQCRVFVVHASLSLGNHLFQTAKRMRMMEKEYVWIATNLITDFIHSLNSSTISSMQGVLGVGSFFPDNGPEFHNFNIRFQKKFKLEEPEEESSVPGIAAARAYDATLAVALALSRKNMTGQKFMETISEVSFDGLTGKVQFVSRKLEVTSMFQILNVVGKSYRQLGFWSEGFGFSEVIGELATYSSSMQILGQVFWPGGPLHTPRGWALPTTANPLRVGVPAMAIYKQFVKVEYDDKDHTPSFSGYAIELFNETVKHLPYHLEYKFFPYNGTYDSLVEQVNSTKFDAVVGDVSVVGRRCEYAEFTHPYTETGLVMVVPVESYHNPWLFVKPFTMALWGCVVAMNIYNGFVVWLIERDHINELQGSALNKTGTFLWLAFTRTLYADGNRFHSNLARMTILVWLVVGVIFVQSYTASLTSMLTVRRLIPKVANLETLINGNAIVGIDDGTFVAEYMVDVLGFKPSNIKNFTSPDGYPRAFRNGEIAAAFLEAPYAKLFLAKYCKSFIAAGPVFKVGGFAFVLPKASPMLHNWTVALLNVSENGFLRDLENKMLSSEECIDLEPDSDQNDSLGLDSFWSLFLLTSATSTISLASYCIMQLWKHYKTMRSEPNGAIWSEIKRRLFQKRQLSRKVSDVESPKGVLEIDLKV